ncbi:MAG: SIMPL domain-containing protein [Alphaproteobacteria bacterium]|nr:SIMPL domain-containing protein [Alphaproteobacteria bacterium]
MSRQNLFLPALVLAIGIATAGYFGGNVLYKAKVALNTAEVKGLAERRVTADRANWTIFTSVAGTKKANVPELYKTIESNQQKVVDILKENGFTDEEIKVGVINYGYNEYRDENQKLVEERHNLSGSIQVETDKIDKVEKVRGEINKLIAQGIDINNNLPIYRFTKLNDIKPEMLREATQNARLAANEFAVNAGVHVGSIRSAQQGGFYIRDAGEEYSDTQKIEKDVRVVTTITFYLTD